MHTRLAYHLQSKPDPFSSLYYLLLAKDVNRLPSSIAAKIVAAPPSGVLYKTLANPIRSTNLAFGKLFCKRGRPY